MTLIHWSLINLDTLNLCNTCNEWCIQVDTLRCIKVVLLIPSTATYTIVPAFYINVKLCSSASQTILTFRQESSSSACSLMAAQSFSISPRQRWRLSSYKIEMTISISKNVRNQHKTLHGFKYSETFVMQPVYLWDPCLFEFEVERSRLWRLDHCLMQPIIS